MANSFHSRRFCPHRKWFSCWRTLRAVGYPLAGMPRSCWGGNQQDSLIPLRVDKFCNSGSTNFTSTAISLFTRLRVSDTSHQTGQRIWFSGEETSKTPEPTSALPNILHSTRERSLHYEAGGVINHSFVSQKNLHCKLKMTLLGLRKDNIRVWVKDALYNQELALYQLHQTQTAPGARSQRTHRMDWGDKEGSF